MNRRRLFKTMGAAAIVAPVALVAVIEPVKAEPERVVALRESSEAAYERGLSDGLNGAIDRYFSIDQLATVTMATANGRYAARLTDS